MQLIVPNHINICSISNSSLVIWLIDGKRTIYSFFFLSFGRLLVHGHTITANNATARSAEKEMITERTRRHCNWNRLSTWTTKEKKFTWMQPGSNIHHINVKTAMRCRRHRTQKMYALANWEIPHDAYKLLSTGLTFTCTTPNLHSAISAIHAKTHNVPAKSPATSLDVLLRLEVREKLCNRCNALKCATTFQTHLLNGIVLPKMCDRSN